MTHPEMMKAFNKLIHRKTVKAIEVIQFDEKNDRWTVWVNWAGAGETTHFLDYGEVKQFLKGK